MSLISSVQIYKQMEERICSIHTSKGSATGFFISEQGMLATVLHVIPIANNRINAADITVKYKQKDYSVSFVVNDVISSFFNKTDIDLCLLQILPPISTPCFSLMQKSFSDLKIGTKVYFAGFPLNQKTLTFHKGMISSVPLQTNEIQQFTIDGTIVKGNSGGPVVEVFEGKLRLIGMIFQTAADLNESFYISSQILDNIKNKRGQGFMISYTYTNEKGEEIKETKSETQLLLNIIDVLKNNISTGIGRALHAQYISQMLSSPEISSYESSSINLNMSGILTRSEPTDIPLRKKDISSIREIDNIKISEAQQTLCKFIIENARNKEAITQAQGFQKGQSKLEQIKKLDLTGRSLETLPEEISLLPNLLYLDLTSNKFKELPPPIFNLKKLKVLVLRGNNLTTLPDEELLKLKSLNEVDILENPITKVPATLQRLIWSLPYMAEWS